MRRYFLPVVVLAGAAVDAVFGIDALLHGNYWPAAINGTVVPLMIWWALSLWPRPRPSEEPRRGAS